MIRFKPSVGEVWKSLTGGGGCKSRLSPDKELESFMELLCQEEEVEIKEESVLIKSWRSLWELLTYTKKRRE